LAAKLAIWNEALREIGQTRLSDTGDTVESARALTDVYDNVVADCLAEGSWNFAMETVKLAADTGVEPSFGFTEVFAKPPDWVRTWSVSQDERFTYPLVDYWDDANFWSADVTPIYVRYVSDDTGLGLELTRWPRAFTRYVELELAARIGKGLNQSDTTKVLVEKNRDRQRKIALNQDAMNEAQSRSFPMGRFNRARRGRAGGDRGNKNSLIG
jgi:hypothetical protein